MKATFPAMVAKELERARTLHTAKLNSSHEAAAVIQEEFEEFWDEVKANPRNTLAMLRELSHLAAMCQRAAEDVMGVELESGSAARTFDLGDEGGTR